MLLYKGVLHGIIQGTSSRPVAAAAVQVILQGSTRFLFVSDKVPENLDQRVSKLSLDVPQKKTDLNCNPLKMCFLGEKVVLQRESQMGFCSFLLS